MNGYSYLTLEQRREIERMYAEGERVVDIAARLKRSAAAIYEELKRGYTGEFDGYIAFVRNRDKDKESNVKHDATVLTEIGYIKANTDEIKAEQKEQRKTNTEFVTRLTDVEASAKQAHKRLDHIEKRMDQAE